MPPSNTAFLAPEVDVDKDDWRDQITLFDRQADARAAVIAGLEADNAALRAAREEVATGAAALEATLERIDLAAEALGPPAGPPGPTPPAPPTAPAPGVNRPPVAVGDTFTVTANVTDLPLDVLRNDTDPDLDRLSLLLWSDPAHGTARVDGLRVLYTPARDYVGPDGFVYRINDGRTGTALARVELTVVAAGPGPVVPTPRPLSGDSPALFTGLAALATRPLYLLTPETPYNHRELTSGGDDDFIREVEIDTLGDVTFELLSGGTGSTDLFLFATPRQTTTLGPPLASTVGRAAKRLTAVNLAPGRYLLKVASTAGAATEFLVRASVVEPAAPPPAPLNRAPVAVDDTLTIQAGSAAVRVAVLANDTDPDNDPLGLSIISPPTGGQARVDGTAIVYTPPASAMTDVLVYRIGDGKGGIAEAALRVTVTPPPQVNRPPTAVDDLATILAGSVNSRVRVLANDTDPDNDPLTLTLVTLPAHGAAAVDGVDVLYTPAAGYAGPDSLTYRITDLGGASDTATLAITVLPPPNRPPIAVPESYVIPADAPARLRVLANDTDPDLDPLFLLVIDPPSHGVAVVEVTEIVYTPAAGYAGPDAFTYEVDDGRGGTARATVSLTIEAPPPPEEEPPPPPPVNRPPVALGESFTFANTATVRLRVMGNDTDPDNDPLILTLVTGPSKGSATVDGTEVLYAPNPGALGADSFLYEVSDSRGGSARATATLNLQPPPNRAPVAADDTLTIQAGTAAVRVAVLANDTDPDGNPLTVRIVAPPAAGSAVIDGVDILYTPPGLAASTSLSYEIADPSGATSRAALRITVTAPAPTAAFNVYGYANVAGSPGRNDPAKWSMQDDDGFGRANVAGRDTIDPDAPIFVPIVDGAYDQAALNAVAAIGLRGIPALVDASYSTTPVNGPKGTWDGKFWVLANGIGSGIPFGAAIMWAIQRQGRYATIDDFKTALVNPWIESGEDDGRFAGRPTYSQTTFHGLMQLGSNFHDTTNAYNPWRNLDVAFYVARWLGNLRATNGSYVEDQIVLNTGQAGGNGSTTGHLGISQSYRSCSAMAKRMVFGDTVIATGPRPGVNRPPVAVDDTLTVTAGTSGRAAVLANDSDPDGNPLTLTIVVTPTRGTALIQGTEIVYTPATGVTGADSLVYRIDDGRGRTADATLRVTINPAVVAPVDEFASVPLRADSPADWPAARLETFRHFTLGPSAPVLWKENTAGGDSDYCALVTVPRAMTVTSALSLGSAATNLYVHGADDAGNVDAPGFDSSEGKANRTWTRRFEKGRYWFGMYSSGTGPTTEARFKVSGTIIPASAPQVTTIPITLARNAGPYTIDVLAGATDPVGLPLTLVSLGPPTVAGATAVKSGNNAVYTAVRDWVGTDSFSYTVENAEGLRATGTVAVTVRASSWASAPADARYRPSLAPTGEPWPYTNDPMWYPPAAPSGPATARVASPNDLRAAITTMRNAYRAGRTTPYIIEMAAGTYVNAGLFDLSDINASPGAEWVVRCGPMCWDARFTGSVQFRAARSSYGYLRGMRLDGVNSNGIADSQLGNGGRLLGIREGCHHLVFEDIIVHNTFVSGSIYYHHSASIASTDGNAVRYCAFRRCCFVNNKGNYQLGVKPEVQNVKHAYFIENYFYKISQDTSQVVSLQVGTNQRERLREAQGFVAVVRNVFFEQNCLNECETKISNCWMDGNVLMDNISGYGSANRAWDTISIRGGQNCFITNNFIKSCDIGLDCHDGPNHVRGNIVLDAYRPSSMRGAISAIDGSGPAYSTSHNDNNQYHRTRLTKFYFNTFVNRTNDAGGGAVRFIYYQRYGGRAMNRSTDPGGINPEGNEWYGNLMIYLGAVNVSPFQNDAGGSYNDGSYSYNHLANNGRALSPFPGGTGNQTGDPGLAWKRVNVTGPAVTISDTVTKVMELPHPIAGGGLTDRAPGGKAARDAVGRDRGTGRTYIGALLPAA